MHIRVNDIVQVIAGDDKGKRGKVLAVDRAGNKVTVQGVNLVYRHMKPSRVNPQGGRLSKEMPMDASNVQLIDPTTNRPPWSRASRCGGSSLWRGRSPRSAR